MATAVKPPRETPPRLHTMTPPVPPPPVPPIPAQRRAPNGWTGFAKTVAAVLPIITAVIAALYWAVRLDERMKTLPTREDLQKTEKAILDSLTRHDTVFRIMLSALVKHPGMSIDEKLVNKILDRAGEKVGAKLRWSGEEFAPPSNGFVRREASHLACLSFESTAVWHAGPRPAVVVETGPGRVALRLESSRSQSASLLQRVWGGLPSVYAADSTTETLIYSGLTPAPLIKGDKIAVLQRIGTLETTREGVLAAKLLLEWDIGGKPVPPPEELPELDLGEEVFLFKCSVCHDVNTRAQRTGPGLQGLNLKNRKLLNGRQVTRASLLDQINKGCERKPSFERTLSEEEKQSVIDYILEISPSWRRPR